MRNTFRIITKVALLVCFGILFSLFIKIETRAEDIIHQKTWSVLPGGEETTENDSITAYRNQTVHISLVGNGCCYNSRIDACDENWSPIANDYAEGHGSSSSSVVYIKDIAYNNNDTDIYRFWFRTDDASDYYYAANFGPVKYTLTINWTETPTPSPHVDSSEPENNNPSDPPAEPENEFEKAVNASNSQITGTVNQLNALLASGKTVEVNALRAKGITIDAEKDNLMCFKNGTYDLIYKATQAGIPVTINFRYMGFRYATTIPAYTKLNPVTLCDKDGFCGFCNIMYQYGGRLR